MRFLFLSFLFFAAGAALAQEALTLPEAIGAALRGQPELRVWEARVAAAHGAVTKARTLANPELTLAPGVKRTRETGRTTTEFHGEIALSQLFQFPGRRALEVAIARREAGMPKLALEGFRFQLSARVRKAFAELLAAEKVAGLREEQVESARTFVEAARKRAESGYASDFETVKSQADLIAARKALEGARGEMAGARVTLNTLMGRAPTAPLAITGTLERAAPRGEADGSLALALARHPAVRAASAQAEVAGLTLRSTRLGRRPDFAVGPSLEWTESEQILGFSGTIALPLWDRKRGEIETAAGEQQKALAELAKTRAEIAGEVARAAAAWQSARAAAALYTPEFLAQLKALVAQAEQSYARSATTLIIYLEARRTWFDTLRDYYEALGREAASRAELDAAIGVPPETAQP